MSSLASTPAPAAGDPGLPTSAAKLPDTDTADSEPSVTQHRVGGGVLTGPSTALPHSGAHCKADEVQVFLGRALSGRH